MIPSTDNLFVDNTFVDNTFVAIVGGGPAGLMAAEVISQAGLSVHLYDAMPSVGRKFLQAGKGGLNLTHSEPFDQFLGRYGDRRPQIEPLLRQFNPQALRDWAQELGIDTFVGTSGRVFPVEMKAAPLLRAWLRRLRANGVTIHTRHRWMGWTDGGQLRLVTPDGETAVSPVATILALGGGSWAKLGSDGAWISLLQQRGIPIAPLQPANCGFDIGWSDHFRQKFAGSAIKTIGLTFTNSQGVTFQRQGEFVLTETGVEGSLIYAVSALVRDEITAVGQATILIDLSPHKTESQLRESLAKPRGSRSMANHLQSRVRIKGAKANLLREIIPPADFADPARLATAIKALPLQLIAFRPIDEAISTAGGVAFEALDDHLMVHAWPGLFCAGEMLDWEAPTGGYLLTACFASGHAAGLGVRQWLERELSSLVKT